MLNSIIHNLLCSQGVSMLLLLLCGYMLCSSAISSFPNIDIHRIPFSPKLHVVEGDRSWHL